jgi:hypothetical protein
VEKTWREGSARRRLICNKNGSQGVEARLPFSRSEI